VSAKINQSFALIIHSSNESFPYIQEDYLSHWSVSSDVVIPVTTAVFQSSFSSDAEDSYMILFSYYYHLSLQDNIGITQFIWNVNRQAWSKSYISIGNFLIYDEALKHEAILRLKVTKSKAGSATRTHITVATHSASI